MNIRGVVFDLDATLVNLGEHVEWGRAKDDAKAAYLACGCSEESLRRCDRRGLQDFLNAMSGELQVSLTSEEAAVVTKRVFDAVDVHELRGVPLCGPMPGSRECLEWLRGQGIPLAVCTTNSTEVAHLILHRLDFSRFISSVVGRSPSLRLKPHPDQVLACFREIGVEPREGLMVGDSHSDVIAGKAAGARTIAVPVYFTRLESLQAAKPDAIIKSLLELPEALRRLGSSEVEPE